MRSDLQRRVGKVYGVGRHALTDRRCYACVRALGDACPPSCMLVLHVGVNLIVLLELRRLGSTAKNDS